MKKFKQWVLSLIVWFLCILTIVVIFNVSINPYNTFPFLHQSFVNHYKKRVLSDRMTKFYELKHIQPKTILMGTSRSGLFPSSQLQPYSKAPIYNLSLAGSSIEEQSQYLKYAIDHYKVNTIIWSLDFFAFNPDKPTNSSFEIERLSNKVYWPDITASLFYFKTIEKSINTIKDSVNHINTDKAPTHLYESAQYIHMQNQKFTTIEREQNLNKTLLLYKLSDGFLKSHRFTQKDSINSNIEHLRKIISICKKKDITVKLYISPIHEEHLKLIYDLGLKGTYNAWKEKIANISSFYDFSIPNSITRDIHNFRDSSHVNSKIGNLIFARLFNQENNMLPSDFGILITNKTNR